MHALYTTILTGVVSLGFPRREWSVVLGDFSIYGQVVADDRTKVGELVYHFKFLVVDGDDRWCIHVLA